MLCFKSAQIPPIDVELEKSRRLQADFANVDVRRIFGYITAEQHTCESKLATIRNIQEQTNLIFQGIPNATMADLQETGELWEMIQSVLGSDHWSFNPNQL